MNIEELREYRLPLGQIEISEWQNFVVLKKVKKDAMEPELTHESTAAVVCRFIGVKTNSIDKRNH